MLEMVDLRQRLKKQDYQDQVPRLEIKLAELQRRAKQQEVPIIVVVAGWDASGKGSLINKLVLSLDPRGYDVHAMDGPDQERDSRPFLWGSWMMSCAPFARLRAPAGPTGRLRPSGASSPRSATWWH